MNRSQQTLFFSLSAFLLHCYFAATAFAMIEGGEGNDPIRDPGWPEGAAEVFNWPTRIAYWVGPPFGGGQWHAESKGDAKEVNKVLQAFAKIKSEKKRVVVKDGIGYSFWLDPNQKKRADRKTKIDWELMVWVKKSWDFQKTLPSDLTSIRSQDKSPVPVLTIYTASVRWSDLEFPKGLEVVDQTLEGNGYTREDGRVIDGVVSHAETGKPVKAKIRVEEIEPKKEGGYKYTEIENLECDASGKWVMKNCPDRWLRFIAHGEGYAPRVFHYARYDKQPGWEKASAQLADATTIAGKVVDGQGKPLAEAGIILRSVTAADGGRYELLQTRYTADAKGKFRIEGLPKGSCNLTGYKEGYQGGMGVKVKTPELACVVQLASAGSVKIKVMFGEGGKTAKNYNVSISPKAGDKVGSWGGSANINDQNEFLFKNVPPGEYLVHGHPNPGRTSDRTDDVLVKVEGGKQVVIELKAK